MTRNRLGAGLAASAVALAAVATVAMASEHRGREHEHLDRDDPGEARGDAPLAARPGDAELRALYRKECGACHLDYPPGLLTAASHRRILAGLDRHFGQDAALEPAVRDRLERWLVGSAADTGGADRRSRKIAAVSAPGEAPLRVTEGPWFEREHRKMGAGVLARPSIRTFANCGACHPGASGWDFEEDRVKIPAR